MKTFTVRDLDRQPAEVLDVCDREGVARIRRRDGRTYTMRPEQAPAGKVAWRKLVSEHRARIVRIFPEPLTKKQTGLVDEMIAGE
jgi:hypothetical protein